MKKSLLALAALTAFAGAASAQSSVTLFGVIDASLMRVSYGSAGTTNSMATDGASSNRIGFRGIEDLGGGMRAGFWIEGGFGPDTGCGGGSLGTPATCAGQTWQRRSTVSLLGGFGEVRLGRDYTTTFNNIAAYDPFGYNGLSHVGNLRSVLGSGATTAVRANNTVAYFLPAMGGLYGQFQGAFDEGSLGNKEVGARIGYAAGPLNVSGAYQKTYHTTIATGQTTMLDHQKTFNVGASFDFGVAKIMGSYEKEDYRDEGQKLWLVGVVVPLGSGQLKASYVNAKGSSALLDKSGNQYTGKQLGVGYYYDLSKRTTVYTNYSRIQNGGNSTVGGSFLVYGANGGVTTGFKSGETNSGFQVGVRHLF